MHKAVKVISVKDLEKSCANTAARSRKIYEKDLEKSYESLNMNETIYDETGLAISYKRKKTAAVKGVAEPGLGGLQPPPRPTIC